MAKYYADLHCHSTASDGSDTPSKVVERAKQVGLKVLSLTDHDTVAGVDEAIETGRAFGVRILVGTELTCYIGSREVHVLGYGIDHRSPALLAHCDRFQAARLERAKLIGERLAAAGVPIDMGPVIAQADGGVVGRPHIARALLDAGHVQSFNEAFDKYLGEGCPANVPKLNVSPEECVAVIRDARGIAIMAHPALGNHYDLIPTLIDAGCMGIETCHSAHSDEQMERLQVIALDRNLMQTGGSDCHGSIKNQAPILGRYGLGKSRWEKFEKLLKDSACPGLT